MFLWALAELDEQTSSQVLGLEEGLQGCGVRWMMMMTMTMMMMMMMIDDDDEDDDDDG